MRALAASGPSSFSVVLTPTRYSHKIVRDRDWVRNRVTNKSRKRLILGPRDSKRSKSVGNGEPLFWPTRAWGRFTSETTFRDGEGLTRVSCTDGATPDADHPTRLPRSLETARSSRWSRPGHHSPVTTRARRWLRGDGWPTRRGILIGGGERFHDSPSGPPYSADAARLNRASGTAGRRGGAPRRLLGRCHVVDALGRVRRARQARDV